MPTSLRMGSRAGVAVESGTVTEKHEPWPGCDSSSTL